MRVNAYVLAGDPAWVRDSVLSYYDLVSTIVVSYDQDHRGWRGNELPVPEVLDLLRSIDRDRKLVEVQGRYCDPSRFVLDVETEQRQAALDRAAEGADWVLQIDTDEVVASPDRLLRSVAAAESVGAGALEYPLRYFYQRTAGDRFLEKASRTFRPRAGYPGPVAVRAGTRLVHCRQADAPLYRVDLRHRNTDPSHPPDARVDEVVAPDEAIIHLWLVRTEQQMRRKLRSSGHADFYSRTEADLRRWKRGARHPFLTALGAPFQREDRRLRVTRSPVTLVSGDWYQPA